VWKWTRVLCDEGVVAGWVQQKDMKRRVPTEPLDKFGIMLALPKV